MLSLCRQQQWNILWHPFLWISGEKWFNNFTNRTVTTSVVLSQSFVCDMSNCGEKFHYSEQNLGILVFHFPSFVLDLVQISFHGTIDEVSDSFPFLSSIAERIWALLSPDKIHLIAFDVVIIESQSTITWKGHEKSFHFTFFVGFFFVRWNFSLLSRNNKEMPLDGGWFTLLVIDWTKSECMPEMLYYY